ncbi:MAG: hypothetical protein ACRCUX_00675 [Beijerinckiaceae bacterium]
MPRLLPALLSLVPVIGLAACARGPDQRGPVIPAEHRTIPWTGATPACDDPAVIGKISSRFTQREQEFWNSSLAIVRVDHIRTTAHRPWGPSFIPRRYCTARAHFNDNRMRTMVYSVGEDTGIIGATWGVMWCVTGLDRHNAYAPWCKAAGP